MAAEAATGMLQTQPRRLKSGGEIVTSYAQDVRASDEKKKRKVSQNAFFFLLLLRACTTIYIVSSFAVYLQIVKKRRDKCKIRILTDEIT